MIENFDHVIPQFVSLITIRLRILLIFDLSKKIILPLKKYLIGNKKELEWFQSRKKLCQNEPKTKKNPWNTIKNCQQLLLYNILQLYYTQMHVLLLCVYSAFVLGANQKTLLDHSSNLTPRKNELVQSTAGDNTSQAYLSFQEVAEMTDNAIWWTTRAFFHA